MGTPLPNLSDALSCPICWGPGRALGLSPPPLQVTLTFADIGKTLAWVPGAGEPPDGDFILPQHSDDGCFYVLEVTDNLVMFVFFQEGQTRVESTSTAGHSAYISTDGECEKESENEGTTFFEGGTAVVTI